MKTLRVRLFAATLAALGLTLALTIAIGAILCLGMELLQQFFDGRLSCMSAFYLITFDVSVDYLFLVCCTCTTFFPVASVSCLCGCFCWVILRSQWTGVIPVVSRHICLCSYRL